MTLFLLRAALPSRGCIKCVCFCFWSIDNVNFYFETIAFIVIVYFHPML